MKKGLLTIALFLTLAVGLSSAAWGAKAAPAASSDPYGQLYRPQLTFTPQTGWNNDPNGLVYYQGRYHMYYQYYPQAPVWGDMHWGHAVSTDLVHWEERGVAMYPNLAGYPGYDASLPCGPMFSGSAVYDEYNTSGLFETDADGRVVPDQGLVAILTQPNCDLGHTGYDQRQIAAASFDGGDTFKPVAEIIANNTAMVSDGDFRDPKVFYHEESGQWVMAVGGGQVRIFVSGDLLHWELTQETGLWGECPDLFPLGDRWVLLVSPEDKEQSHAYNGTDRDSHSYPNEFYVIGDFDGYTFTPETGLRPVSFGIDSYAVQTFNDAPDGKRYGISWAASWKTVGAYVAAGNGYTDGLRENWNGGMTVAYELTLETRGGETVLCKNPVEAFDALRGQTTFEESFTLDGEKALPDTSVGEIELTIGLDTAAKEIAVSLFAGGGEETLLSYRPETGLLTLDRSRSSLAAADTPRYTMPRSAQAVPDGDTLSLRILLDRGYVSVFADNGAASCVSAVFPSLSSTGVKLRSDAPVDVTATVRQLKSVHTSDGSLPTVDKLYLSNAYINMTVGSARMLAASSFAEGAVTWSVTEGADVVTVQPDGRYASVTADKPGKARVEVRLGDKTRTCDVYVYEDGYQGDVDFPAVWAGSWFRRQDGLCGDSLGAADAFVFSRQSSYNFTYSATIAAEADAQAAGLLFRANDDYTAYYCANVDFVDGIVKLWCVNGDIAVVPVTLDRTKPLRYRVEAFGPNIRIYLNDDPIPVVDVEDDRFSGTNVGLNIYNGKFSFNDVRFGSLDYRADGNDVSVPVGAGDAAALINETDLFALVPQSAYTVGDGLLTLSKTYLEGLPGGTYAFRLTMQDGDRYRFTVTVDAARAFVSGGYDEIEAASKLVVYIEGAEAVSQVTVDGVSVTYTFRSGKLELSGETVAALQAGTHMAAIATDRGELFYLFSIRQAPPADPVKPPKSKTPAKVISAVSAGLLLAAFVGFAGYWVVGYRKRKG